jgi:thiosulfate/3-mercaptopyruvate sulfurtransferase
MLYTTTNNWWTFLLLGSALLITGCQTEPPPLSHPLSDYLMEPVDVAELVGRQAPLHLIEVSKPEHYHEGHIPGAQSLWRPDYEGQGFAYGGMRMSSGELAGLLGKHGIAPGDSVLLYDVKGSADALRLWWMLRMYGHEHVYVLNGGKKSWEMDGYSLDTIVPPIPYPVTYKFAHPPDLARLIEKEELTGLLQDTNYVLLDTREPEEYKGLPYIDNGVCYSFKKGAFTYGRIPGSVHLNWSDAVDLHGDHRFKSLKDLRYNFERAGITPDKTIIAYCQSGVRSAHTTFVLTEVLGYPNVRNYDGSWIEWSYYATQDASLPIERDVDELEHQRLLAELNKSLQD